jgi:[CysO sulfur-carrier protein]-S-L-cysteine hydrolase
MRIARDLYDQIVAHAREEAPNECCGIVGARDGEAKQVYRAQSLDPSPYRFEIEPHDQIRIWNEIEDNGYDAAIYHSHVRTEPRPSPADINFAREWPGTVWIIVGLAEDPPEVRAWHIEDGLVRHAELVVE